MTSLRNAFIVGLVAAVSASACGDDGKSTSGPGSHGGSSGTSGASGSSGTSSGGSAGVGGSGAPTGGSAGSAGTSPGTGGSATGGRAGSGQGGSSEGGSGGAEAGMGGENGGQGGESGGQGGAGGEGGAELPPLPPAQTFGPVQMLSTGQIGHLVLAMGAFGNATVVWEDSSSDRIWSRVATNKAFAGQERVDGVNGRPSVYPAGAGAVGQNAFFTVWIENNEGFGAYARKYENGWGSIQTLENSATTYSTAHLAVNAAGDGILGMELRNINTGGDESAAVRRITAGVVGASEDLRLHQTTIAVETAAADNGNAIVAWLEPEGTGYEIWARRLDHTNGWVAAERIAAPAAAVLVRAAAFDDGRVLLLWEEDSSTAPKLWESVYQPGTGWRAPRRLGFDMHAFTGIYSIARSRSGALLWIYNEHVSGADVPLLYRIRSPRGVWSDAQTLVQNAEQWTPVTIAPYDSESFRIAYTKPDAVDIGHDLYSARYVPGYGFVNAEPVATDYYLQEFAAVAVDPTGRGLVVWRHRDAATLTPIISLHARWFE